MQRFRIRFHMRRKGVVELCHALRNGGCAAGYSTGLGPPGSEPLWFILLAGKSRDFTEKSYINYGFFLREQS